VKSFALFALLVAGCAIHLGTTKNVFVAPDVYEAGTSPFLSEAERLDAGISVQEAKLLHDMQWNACQSRVTAGEAPESECIDMLTRWDDELAKQLDNPVAQIHAASVAEAGR